MPIQYIKRGKTIEQKADADAQVEATVRGFLPNEYYATKEEYLWALAEALNHALENVPAEKARGSRAKDSGTGTAMIGKVIRHRSFGC